MILQFNKKYNVTTYDQNQMDKSFFHGVRAQWLGMNGFLDKMFTLCRFIHHEQTFAFAQFCSGFFCVSVVIYSRFFRDFLHIFMRLNHLLCVIFAFFTHIVQTQIFNCYGSVGTSKRKERELRASLFS